MATKVNKHSASNQFFRHNGFVSGTLGRFSACSKCGLGIGALHKLCPPPPSLWQKNYIIYQT
jgi:hypothetical protein